MFPHDTEETHTRYTTEVSCSVNLRPQEQAHSHARVGWAARKRPEDVPAPRGEAPGVGSRPGLSSTVVTYEGWRGTDSRRWGPSQGAPSPESETGPAGCSRAGQQGPALETGVTFPMPVRATPAEKPLRTLDVCVLLWRDRWGLETHSLVISTFNLTGPDEVIQRANTDDEGQRPSSSPDPGSEVTQRKRQMSRRSSSQVSAEPSEHRASRLL